MRIVLRSTQYRVKPHPLGYPVYALVILLFAASPVPAFQPEAGQTDSVAAVQVSTNNRTDNAVFVEQSNAPDLRHLRQADPKRYADELETLLLKVEKRLANNEAPEPGLEYPPNLVDAYTGLAEYVRFTLSDPVRAVRLYEKAIALSKPIPRYWGLPPRLGIADTLRFDMKNIEQATFHYRKALELAPKDPSDQFDYQNPRDT